MAKTVCLISESDAAQLLTGEKLTCRDHRHVSRDEAQLMCTGTKFRPWLPVANFEPEARWAVLPDGRISRKHIIAMESYEWRGVSSKVETYIYGWKARGYTVMQLVSQARTRR